MRSPHANGELLRFGVAARRSLRTLSSDQGVAAPVSQPRRDTRTGEVAEWSIATVLKTVGPKGPGGSNPSLSASAHLNSGGSCRRKLQTLAGPRPERL